MPSCLPWCSSVSCSCPAQCVAAVSLVSRLVNACSVTPLPVMSRVVCHRVLQPGGSFLLVTLGDPTRRLPLLCDARLPWKVSLLLLPKISAANQAYVDGK